MGLIVVELVVGGLVTLFILSGELVTSIFEIITKFLLWTVWLYADCEMPRIRHERCKQGSASLAALIHVR